MSQFVGTDWVDSVDNDVFLTALATAQHVEWAGRESITVRDWIPKTDDYKKACKQRRQTQRSMEVVKIPQWSRLRKCGSCADVVSKCV